MFDASIALLLVAAILVGLAARLRQRASSVLSLSKMIRKVYEVNPMVCPHCGEKMRVIAFLTDYAVVDRIINHLKLTFVAERPPPPHLAHQKILMAAEPGGDYFS